ncbi:MAG: orotidine-5'-phosphate decarboxylase [Deltaproteobacteria bacterium]|nr:orotidine-5'-phosphate decarboxylase [Deltaproteobacteria bacterium]
MEYQAAPVLIIALDGMEESQALALARELAPLTAQGPLWGFKVNDLLLRCGVQIIRRLKTHGRVFADPKLYDIPNTVANQVALLADSGADLITLHCSGGPDMLLAARQAAQNVSAGSGEKPGLLGVTVLTAMNDATTQTVYGQNAAPTVEKLAGLALAAGLDGIVCSPLELALMDRLDPRRALLRVTPGVRPADYAIPDDQQRVMTPAAAMKHGADLLVVGRPVTGAADPVAACLALGRELESLDSR